MENFATDDQPIEKEKKVFFDSSTKKEIIIAVLASLIVMVIGSLYFNINTFFTSTSPTEIVIHGPLKEKDNGKGIEKISLFLQSLSSGKTIHTLSEENGYYKFEAYWSPGDTLKIIAGGHYPYNIRANTFPYEEGRDSFYQEFHLSNNAYISSVCE